MKRVSLQTLLVFLFTLFVVPVSFAFEKPYLYFDWNNAWSTQKQVLGVSTKEQDAQSYQRPQYFFNFLSNVRVDSPWYVLKRTEENIGVAFTLDPLDKEQKRLSYAAERLAELSSLTQEGKQEFIAKAADEYGGTVQKIAENLTTLKEKGKDVKYLSSQIDIETAKHTLILEQLSLKLPESAQQGIKTAITASEETLDTVADLVGKPAVPQAVVGRLESLKAQGILTEAEVNKLIMTDSRQKARQEIRKYAESGLIPQADYKKMDESVQANFPETFSSVIETKKLEELKTLEKQKQDEQTVKRLQEFAKTYKPGDVVPSDLKSSWAVMVRTDELQNTVRPDLVKKEFIKQNQETEQKYKEIIERMKPRQEDIEQMNKLQKQNSSLLNEPGYVRLKQTAEKFGTATEVKKTEVQTEKQPSCSQGTHWVSISFRPDGGYCAPNYTYSTPQYPTISGDSYPNTFTAPANCPSGQIFKEGKCTNFTTEPKPTTMPAEQTQPTTVPQPSPSSSGTTSVNEPLKMCQQTAGCRWENETCKCGP